MQDTLFTAQKNWQPLAARMRPQTLADYLGQEHLLGADGTLKQALSAGQLHSMIFWGPPGVGKTTLAQLLAQQVKLDFVSLSAVMSGVKEIRAAVEQAQAQQAYSGQPTLLFVDEVHRFNKAQQDAFLPYIEEGTFIFIGATTENPAFELNSALLSRARVYLLKPLTKAQLIELLNLALTSPNGLADKQLTTTDDSLKLLAQAADGDARKALNLLEIAADLAADTLTSAIVKQVIQQTFRRFDKGGDEFYEQISALHKSIRGSNPDAALYWLCRMLDGGCDVAYLARRLVVIASEDIGNADPRALEVSLNAWEAFTRLGQPEGEYALAQAVTYLAVAPKSNAVYAAYKACRAMVKQQPSYPVPLHLRNAPSKLMTELSYGKEYRYAHDEPDAYAAGETYFPDELLADTNQTTDFYQPVNRGLERKIAAKMQHLQQLDKDWFTQQ